MYCLTNFPLLSTLLDGWLHLWTDRRMGGQNSYKCADLNTILIGLPFLHAVLQLLLCFSLKYDLIRCLVTILAYSFFSPFCLERHYCLISSGPAAVLSCTQTRHVCSQACSGSFIFPRSVRVSTHCSSGPSLLGLLPVPRRCPKAERPSTASDTRLLHPHASSHTSFRAVLSLRSVCWLPSVCPLCV